VIEGYTYQLLHRTAIMKIESVEINWGVWPSRLKGRNLEDTNDES